MFVTIIGAAASGKSEFAEKLALKFGGTIAYIATMEKAGAEDVIARHITMREGKGFYTIEVAKGIDKVNLSNYDTIIIECISNLLANELFSFGDVLSVYRGINKFDNKNIIVVTNNIFSDVLNYGDNIVNYIEQLGKLNVYLSERSDTVVEIVAGLPIYLKGSL